MLPIVSAALTAERAVQRLTIAELAQMAGVTLDEVFDAEDFLDDVDPVSVNSLLYH